MADIGTPWTRWDASRTNTDWYAASSPVRFPPEGGLNCQGAVGGREGPPLVRGGFAARSGGYRGRPRMSGGSEPPTRLRRSGAPWRRRASTLRSEGFGIEYPRDFRHSVPGAVQLHDASHGLVAHLSRPSEPDALRTLDLERVAGALADDPSLPLRSRSHDRGEEFARGGKAARALAAWPSQGATRL
jgi:hypothetical protein